MLVLGGQLKLYGCVYTFTCTTSAFAYRTAFLLNQDTCCLLMYILNIHIITWCLLTSLILSLKLTYSLKINGWKIKFPFGARAFFKGRTVRLATPLADLWDTLTVHGRLSRMCSCVGMAQQVAVEAGMSVHPRKLTSFHVSFPGWWYSRFLLFSGATQTRYITYNFSYGTMGGGQAFFDVLWVIACCGNLVCS